MQAWQPRNSSLFRWKVDTSKPRRAIRSQTYFARVAELPFGLDFVLVDLWKDLYVPCLEAFFPKLNPGAIVVADNMLYPGGEEVQRYSRAVRAMPGMTSILVPVGNGLEISRLELR